MGLRERLKKILDGQAYIDCEDAMLVQSFDISQRLDTEPGVYGLYATLQIGDRFTQKLLCSFDHPEQGEVIAENLNNAWRRICNADDVWWKKGMQVY